MKPIKNETLGRAVSLGQDFAGLITFEDLENAMEHQRHKILSIYRRPRVPWIDDPNYEVVLKAER